MLRKHLLCVIAALCLLCCGCRAGSLAAMNQQQLTLLYFPDRESGQLTEEKRFGEKEELSTTEQTISFLLCQLQKGPESEQLLPVFPADATASLAGFSGRIATVSFDSSLSSGTGSGTGDFLLLYSITKTLTHLPQVERVIFTVDGTPAEWLQGFFNVTNRLSVDELKK